MKLFRKYQAHGTAVSTEQQQHRADHTEGTTGEQTTIDLQHTIAKTADKLGTWTTEQNARQWDKRAADATIQNNFQKCEDQTYIDQKHNDQ